MVGLQDGEEASNPSAAPTDVHPSLTGNGRERATSTRPVPTDANQQLSQPHTTENQARITTTSQVSSPTPSRQASTERVAQLQYAGRPPTHPRTPSPPGHSPSTLWNNSLSLANDTTYVSSVVQTNQDQQRQRLIQSVPFLDTDAPPTESRPSIPSSPVLLHQSSPSALLFFRSSARRANALRKDMLAPSIDTETEKSNLTAETYATSRGSETPQGMESVNLECVSQGQVWRMAAIFVRERLLDTKEYSRRERGKKFAPYKALPSVLRPKSAIVWRDIYDATSAKTDKLSIQTRIEVAAAGRTAYNWLNKRHRTAISEDARGYVQAVLDVICSGMPMQHKSCAINVMQMCFGIPGKDVKPIVDVSMLLADWIIFEHLEAAELSSKPNKPSKPSNALLDHYNQVAMIHVRGQWGGDLIIERETRRRSEVLNYVTHGAVVLAHDEIRTCPCLAEEIITSLVTTRVTSENVFTSDDALKEPGLVRFRSGRFILVAYVVMLVTVATLVIKLSSAATNEGFEKLTGVLTGWSWSLALVSALHFIVVKNVLPGTTLRHLGLGKRQASDLTDMKLGDGALIMLAQDARTNHLLAPGNACAYANRPNGKVQVSEMPSGRAAWKLGLVVTDKFAIKLQQNTPLIRKTVENLDGSIHIDWDEKIEHSAVGRLLRDEVKVGKVYDNTQ